MRITYLKLGPGRESGLVPLGWGSYPRHDGVKVEWFRRIVANLVSEARPV